MDELKKKRLSYSKIFIVTPTFLISAQQSLAATVGHGAAMNERIFESGENITQ